MVASLERVETQYAMMGQKLGEAVEAMATIQNKVQQLKGELRETTREKMQLESSRAELESEIEVFCILNHLTMEYRKITVAIFPSRQSIFPSELLKMPWQSPLLANTRKYSSSRAGPIRVRIPPREYTDQYWAS